LSLPRETALWVAFEHRLIEGADISRAVHEPNSRHCCGKVKQARASVHEWERTWRVGMISDHVLSPFGSKRHDCLGPSTLHYAARWEKSLGQTLIVLNLLGIRSWGDRRTAGFQSCLCPQWLKTGNALIEQKISP